MKNQAQASLLARHGFDLWQAGRNDEAADKYREALSLADPNHFGLDAYHSEYAGVLVALGRAGHAREQYQLALDCALRLSDTPNDTGVAVARYFLGEHLLSMALPEEALRVVEVGAANHPKPEWLLRFVQARALWLLGKQTDARAAAVLSVELSPTQEKREELRVSLGHILGSPAG